MMRFLLILAALAVPAAAMVAAQRARPSTRMVDAVNAFIATLNPTEKAAAVMPFNSEERFNWHFIPRDRQGLPLKAMNPTQRKAALECLSVGLSAKGYTKAERIRALEDVLKEIEKDTMGRRDPEKYYFTVFGTPSADSIWGWRYEGHHCAQNWTIVKGSAIASSPQFFGSNPAEVRAGPMKGTRVLGAEEDLARALLNALTDVQKKEAVISVEAPKDILTAAERKAKALDDKGIPYKSLTKEQQGMLMALIEEYTGAQARDVAQARVTKIRQAGMDNVKFAWMGSVEKNKGHYYRVQGPTFLIEYDNTQNDANHVHAVWRDFQGDFGLDLIALHLGDPHGHHHTHAAE